MSPLEAEPPSMVELSREEDKIRIEEELEVEQKRRAAQRAALERVLVKEEPISLDGTKEVVELGSTSGEELEGGGVESVTSRPRSIPSRRSSGSGPEPFPEFSNDDEEPSPGQKPP